MPKLEIKTLGMGHRLLVTDINDHSEYEIDFDYLPHHFHQFLSSQVDDIKRIILGSDSVLVDTDNVEVYRRREDSHNPMHSELAQVMSDSASSEVTAADMVRSFHGAVGEKAMSFMRGESS